MNTLFTRLLLFVLALTSVCTSESVSAANVSLGDPASGGITYAWTVEDLGATDSSGPIVRHVGALSFNDPINFGDPVGTGWTHTSDWIAVELLQPALLTVDVVRTAGVPNGTGTAGNLLFPALALYSGWDNDDGDHHVYNNSGNFSWAEDLIYVGNEANAGGLTTVSKSFNLAPGLYSIVVGGNPPGSVGSGRQGYTTTLTTELVPEPSTWILATVGAMGVGAFYRRRRRAG